MAKRRGRAVDIYLLGRGIVDGVGQMTLEAMKALQASRLVFDLSGDVAAIRKGHDNVVDLDQDYWTGELSDDVYSRLEAIILDEATNSRPTLPAILPRPPP